MPGSQALRALLALAILLAAGCAGPGRPAPEPGFPAGPGGVYVRAGQNARQIENFLSRYAQGTELREAAEFLAANLPLSDALAMSADDLSEHLEYAFLARDSMPWGRDAPFDVFLRFVLPHRMSQEPVQPWRAAFYKELVPLLQGVESVQGAARRVNEWCFERARFEPSTRDDQGPLTTIARGKGRCEELAILLVAALRSVAVPARPCSVPWWRHTDGNHLWVEVYEAGKWHFMGAGEVESDYDLAWFKPALHTAPFLYSLAYGNSTAGLEGDGPAVTRARETFINRTAAYAPKGELALTVTANGVPVPGIPAALHTYNLAAPRAFAVTRTNEDGLAEVVLGTGVFLVTAASGEGRDYAFVEIAPDKRTLARLDLDARRMFEGGAWMTFDSDPNLARLIQERYDLARAGAERLIQHLDQARERARGSVVEAALRAAGARAEDIKGALAEAGLNAPEIARAIEAAPESSRTGLVRMIQGMQAKDLADCRARGLIENLGLASAARARLRQKGLLDYDERMFERFVLPERVLYEPFTHWRKDLSGRFRDLEGAGSLEEIIDGVRRTVERLRPVEPSALGAMQGPESVFSSGLYEAGGREVQVAAAAALRAAGVPARALEDWPWAEYHDVAGWRPFKTWTDEPPEGLPAYYEPWAELDLAFTLNGEPVDPKSLHYALDFAILRLDENSGLVGLDEVGLNTERLNGRVIVSFPAGERWLSSARRDSLGRAYVRVEKLTIRPGERLEMTRELAAPTAPSVHSDAFRPGPGPR